MEERRPPAPEADGIIEGRNAVIEALRAGTAIDKIYLQKGETDKTLGHIASKARSAGAVVVEADRRKLDAMSRTHAHQGVIALCAVREYASVEDILQAAADKGEAPLLVVCDELSDPHNLGAVVRLYRTPGDSLIRPILEKQRFKMHKPHLYRDICLMSVPIINRSEISKMWNRNRGEHDDQNHDRHYNPFDFLSHKTSLLRAFQAVNDILINA